MKKHTFVLNGLDYTIEQSLSGDYCRLFYKGILIIDDPACEDFYGEPDQLEDVFKEYINEEASKRMLWWLLIGAIYEWGSDSKRIEDRIEAESISDVLENATEFKCVTDFEEIEQLKSRLDLDDCICNRIYTFVNGSSGSLCLDEDWDY